MRQFTYVSKAFELGWPAPGSLSKDGVAIAGHDGALFIYRGSNYEHSSYRTVDFAGAGGQWSQAISERHALLAGHGISALTAIVPNKSSALRDQYPLWKRVAQPEFISQISTDLAMDSGVITSAHILQSLDGLTDWGDPWGLVDSHWSEFGAAGTANLLLQKLGVDELPLRLMACESDRYGDLSNRWGDRLLHEIWSASIAHDLTDPVVAYDNGGVGSPGRGHVGRIVEWHNPQAACQATLLVLGDSFGGPGYSRTELSYWLSRAFSRCVFVHTTGFPPDVLTRFKPDAVLFEVCERFMCNPPHESMPIEALEQLHREARG